jgi:adenylyl-sulfate kinase
MTHASENAAIVCGSAGSGKSTLISLLSNSKRKFIFADALGLEYLDLALVLIDASKGMVAETRRHSLLISLLGVRQVVLVVNKMDLVNFNQQTFNEIETSFRIFAKQIGLKRVQAIPTSASHGDNVVVPSAKMTWYAGPALMQFLEEVDTDDPPVMLPFRMPVPIADQFEATLVWMSSEPMLPGRTYLMKTGGGISVLATIGLLKYRINVDSLERLAAEKLELNDIGVVEIQLSEDVAFEPYKVSRELGGFTLIDRLSDNALGTGMLHFSLRRAANIRWQALDVNKQVRSLQKKQQACLLWFTGLSGAGKSTIANLVEKRLVSMERHTYLLDGDNVRHGLNKDLGFTPQDRVENIRRVGEVAKLMVDAGLIVLASFISPFRAERQVVRDLLESNEFLEVFVDTPLHVAEQRDTKGLYKKARRGELKNFTGIDSPYERPEQPDIRIDTTSMTAEQAADEIIDRMMKLGHLSGLDQTKDSTALKITRAGKQ